MGGDLLLAPAIIEPFQIPTYYFVNKDFSPLLHLKFSQISAMVICSKKNRQ